MVLLHLGHKLVNPLVFVYRVFGELLELKKKQRIIALYKLLKRAAKRGSYRCQLWQQDVVAKLVQFL